MIKLVAVDLDGTLFGRDHKSVSQRNVNALKKLSENNVKVVIASGRTYSQITNVIKRVGVADYIVCSNGASVIDVNGNVIA
ncbi:MAG: HAD family hydrolase, partial [Clostridia bacterium]|nr:HAD family hydrolase [Clostridia bacterium]